MSRQNDENNNSELPVKYRLESFRKSNRKTVEKFVRGIAISEKIEYAHTSNRWEIIV